MSALTFTTADHQYRIAGKTVPSVTTVIRAVLPGFEASKWYMQLGTSLHKHAEEFDAGNLEWGFVSEEVVGRVKAWQKFRRESDVEIVGAEIPLGSTKYQFAGTLDRIIRHQGDLLVCDLKSTIERR